MGGFDPSAFGQGGFDSNGFSGGGFADIFSTFFGENGGQARAQRGDDLQTELELTFEEAVRGATKEVSLRRTASCTTCSGSGAEAGSSLKSCDGCGGSGQVRRTQRTILGSIVTARPCPTCAGTGKIPEKRCGSCGGSGTTDARERLKVVVPAGVDDGQMIRLTGKGNAAPQIPAGDLYVRLRVRPSKEFVRDGLDIRSTVVISIPQAVLGDEISTTTVQGTVMVKIPAGTTSGTILRLRGKGVARHDGETGSHLLTIEIDVPKKLSRRQKELYEELREQG